MKKLSQIWFRMRWQVVQGHHRTGPDGNMLVEFFLFEKRKALKINGVRLQARHLKKIQTGFVLPTVNKDKQLYLPVTRPNTVTITNLGLGGRIDEFLGQTGNAYYLSCDASLAVITNEAAMSWQNEL